MSRVGKKPIPIPAGATVTIDGQTVSVKGPLGVLECEIRPEIEVRQESGFLHVINRESNGNSRTGRSLHGVSRAIVANNVEGVTKGFSKGLEIVGTGWKAALSGRTLEIFLGYAQPVKMEIPEGLTAEVTDRPPKIVIKGIRKQQVGQFAADVRALRPPEPFLGKGIKYDGEVIRRKAGKSAG